jgi:bacterioferritin-associated ferredoxin
MPDSRKESDLLCACAGLTSRAALEGLAAEPQQSFEQFLTATGAGQTCAACMLDLEYFFVETPRPAAGAAAAGESVGDRRSLKQRFYAWLDRLPPKLPFNRSNWMPVLAGDGITQCLWMANYPLLFGDKDNVAEFNVRFIVREGSGSVAYRGQAQLPANGVLRHNLSQYLKPRNGINIGSVQVDRFARRQAARGTTRPQTEIVMRRSAASLHFQAATLNYDEYLSLPAGRDDEIHYLSAMNCAKRPFGLAIERCGTAAGPTTSVKLGPYETKLIDISQPGRAGELATLHLKSYGLGKLHLVIFNRRLDRISFDHL